MALPNVEVRVRDGGLGLAPNTAGGVFGMVGEASLGDYLPHAVTRASQVAGLFGTGALAQALTDALAAGARQVIACRCAAREDVPGTVEIERTATGKTGAVTAGGSNTSPEIGIEDDADIEGEPTLMLKIVAGGALDVATYSASLNGGETWSDPATLAAVTVVEIGVFVASLACASGSYVQDDTWTIAWQDSTAVVTVDGEPNISLDDIVLRVITAGGRNGAVVSLVVNGVDEEQLTVPVDGVWESVDHNWSMLFGDDQYLVGDEWAITLEGPQLGGVAQIVDASAAIAGQSIPFEAIHVVGPTSPATWAALDALAETEFRARGRYIYFVCEAPLPDDETESEWIAARVAEPALAGSRVRVVVVAGWVGAGDARRSSAAAIMGHAMSLEKISYSPGRVRSGSVGGVTVFGPTDEGSIDALDSAGFTTLRRWDGLSGAYVTNARMLVDQGSDFRWLEFRRVMDEACRQARLAGIRSAHDLGDVQGLLALEADMQAPLNIMVAQRLASAIRVDVPPGQNVIQTSQVFAEVAVQPIPAMRWITVDIGFTTQGEEG